MYAITHSLSLSRSLTFTVLSLSCLLIHGSSGKSKNDRTTKQNKKQQNERERRMRQQEDCMIQQQESAYCMHFFLLFSRSLFLSVPASPGSSRGSAPGDGEREIHNKRVTVICEV
jgi:hypothetical protein